MCSCEVFGLNLVSLKCVYVMHVPVLHLLRVFHYIYFPVNGHLDCFQFLAYMSNAAMNILV